MSEEKGVSEVAGELPGQIMEIFAPFVTLSIDVDVAVKDQERAPALYDDIYIATVAKAAIKKFRESRGKENLQL
jgi:hypothetical protein